MKTKKQKGNMITLGDVILVGYGCGDYPKLRVARIIKILSHQVGFNDKFRIRFIKTGVTEYGSEKGVVRYKSDIIKNFGSQNCKFTLERLVKQFKKEFREQEKIAKAS
jgi:hypothetical protein|tara:strand:+ start:1216 stop:1539 length:324 start_codon:yes stop_codon:yes gene_type:complete